MKKKKRIFMGLIITALIVSSSIISSCQIKKGSDITAMGSTSVQPYAEMLAEIYENDHSGCKVEVQGGGSSLGISAAKSGIADIGMSSRNLKDTEKDDLWEPVEIAKDGLAVIVHPDNPVKNLSLTLEQIRKIYMGEITNWKEVGGNDDKIHVITREEGSGTRAAFEDLVMVVKIGEDKQKYPITPRAIVQDSNGSVRFSVSDDKNSIGFISLGLVEAEKGQKEVVALMLEGVEASVENIINGSYKLSRPFLFVTKEEPAGLTKQFIDFVLSPIGQEILKKEGLIPSHAGE